MKNKALLYTIIILMISAFICYGLCSSTQPTSKTGHKPICQLEINQDCRNNNGRISIQLQGIKGLVFHQEWLVEDTLFLEIIEIDSKRYRETSWMNSPQRDFYINIVFNKDTARIKVVNPSERLYPVYIYEQWFLMVEPLLEIPGCLLWVDIPITINDRNPYTFNSIIRTAKKEIGPLGDIVFPKSGLYRCLSRVELKNTGKTEYSATPSGMALFVQPNKANDAKDCERLKAILNTIRQKSCTIQEVHDGGK